MCSSIAEALANVGIEWQQAEQHIANQLARREAILVNGHVVNDSTYDKYIVVESNDVD